MKRLSNFLLIILLIITLSACKEDEIIEPIDKDIEYNCSIYNDSNITECKFYTLDYLHTKVSLAIYYEDEEFADEIENVFYEVREIIKLYNNISDKYATYEGYVSVKTINDNPTTTHTISSELFELIEFTLDNQDSVNKRFNAALFNAALGPVLSIWHDYRENCQISMVCEVPEMDDLIYAAQYINPDNVILDSENLTITMSENMSLDLGGVSKGVISGKIIEYLNTLDFLTGYLLNNGSSNISVGGTHPTRDHGKFVLAVTDPTNIYDYYAAVYLEPFDELVTSGDYQQNYFVDDTMYHHIIHSTTLMPERFVRSVSIIYNEPGLADIYSTAIFLMPLDEAIVFVDGIEGLEAMWYGLDDIVYFSENFEELYLENLYLE